MAEPVTSERTDAMPEAEGRSGSVLLRVAGFLGIETSHVDQELSKQLTIVVVLLACLAVLPSIVLSFWAAHAFDAFAEGHERILLERAIAEEIETVAADQEGVTHWDDAVTRTRARDQLWMDDNFGVWVSQFYGHDRIYILDEANAPILAVREEANIPPDSFSGVSEAILPLVSALRADLPDSEEPGILTEQDLLSLEGRPALVSVKPIVPSTDQVAFDADGTYVHVSVVYLDGGLLRRLGERNLVMGARFVPPGAEIPVSDPIALVGERQGLLGHVVWTPSGPGAAVIKAIAPGVAVSVAALLAMVVWLLRRLRRAIAQIRASRAQVHHLAFHDTLTGLPNRALFDDRLDQALAHVRRGEGRIAIHYIDLDRFKNVNDTLGHPAGDELIRQVAERLMSITREADTVARLGGDEFVILQSSLRGWDSARKLAERTLQTIREPFTLGSDQAFVGASIGIAVAPDCAIDRFELMRKADIALYQAKSDGKNRFYVFEDSFDEMVRLKREVEEDLRQALSGGDGLSLAYQPFYAVDGETVCGAEALFRWKHPRHSALSPAALIAIAEERGLAADLGEWILREACLTAMEVDLPILSINISPLQFQDPKFPETIIEILSEIGLSAERLQIEIKESMLLENGDSLGPALDRLRDAGIRIALDDFGSGYASFRYLHRFRVDGIKIDRTFVQNMEKDQSTAAMVQVMFDLARAFDIDIVAGGIETESQWKRLLDLGTPNLQGFLFSVPLGRGDLADLLHQPVARASSDVATSSV